MALLAPAPGLSGRNKFLRGWQQGELGARRPLRKRLKPAKHSGSSYLRPSLSLNGSHHPWDSPKPGATAGLLQLPTPPEPFCQREGPSPGHSSQVGPEIRLEAFIQAAEKNEH